MMTENELSYEIIGTAIELHKTLGPGLLESVYEAALAYDLKMAGFDVKTQVAMPLTYKELRHENAYRIDMLVEDKIIIELKSVQELAKVHFAQTLTYLRLSEKKLALLINFNTPRLTEGLHRLVNKL